MLIKICGITRLQDAQLAVELGAAAIGFIFWPGSPRFIAPADARTIARELSGRVKTVGVFVNEPLERVAEVMDSVELDIAQLHGSESPEYVRELARSTIKAIGMKNGALQQIDTFDADVVMLLDAHDPVRHGGTGQTVDWAEARAIAASRRTILSGGLNAANVATAIAAVRPYGIDVSSGVESAPGVKDAARLKDFFEALNG